MKSLEKSSKKKSVDEAGEISKLKKQLLEVTEKLTLSENILYRSPTAFKILGWDAGRHCTTTTYHEHPPR